MKKIIIVLAISFIVFVSSAQYMSIGVTVGSGTGWISNSGNHVVHKESCNVGGTFVYSTDKHWRSAVDV